MYDTHKIYKLYIFKLNDVSRGHFRWKSCQNLHILKLSNNIIYYKILGSKFPLEDCYHLGVICCIKMAYKMFSNAAEYNALKILLVNDKIEPPTKTNRRPSWVTENLEGDESSDCDSLECEHWWQGWKLRL